MITITEAHIDEALAICEAGGRDGIGYDQAAWCGTAMCVLGWARKIAGAKGRHTGPRDGEIDTTPRAQTLARLMDYPRPDVLRVMRAVRPDGRINLAGMDMRGLDLRGFDFTDANLRGTDFCGSDLRWAKFTGADMQGAILTGARRDCVPIGEPR